MIRALFCLTAQVSRSVNHIGSITKEGGSTSDLGKKLISDIETSTSLLQTTLDIVAMQIPPLHQIRHGKCQKGYTGKVFENKKYSKMRQLLQSNDHTKIIM